MIKPAVYTRHVTIVSPDGNRLKKALWSKVKRWNKYQTTAANLRAAITYAKEVLAHRYTGTIVYVGDIPVYHCKWGGGRAFHGWKDNPLAGYWKRQLASK